MTGVIRATLNEATDPGYKAFQQKLLPGVENYLGVRLPLLQKMARGLAKGDWRAALAAPDETYEEVMLRGMVIGAAPMSLEERFCLIRAFLPAINNWGVCDSFCAALREARKYKKEYIGFIKRYVTSSQEFEARFAAVMLLWYWAGPEELEESLALYARIRQPALYARMGVAWGYSVFAATDFDHTLAAMEQAALDDFTWNKALQKMRESRRLTQRQKQEAQRRKRR